MSDAEVFVNTLFEPLEKFLQNAKTILTEIEQGRRTSDYLALANTKDMLNDVMTKLDITQTNTKSTIEHIDSIMASTTGGKKRKKHKKQTRKKRRN